MTSQIPFDKIYFSVNILNFEYNAYFYHYVSSIFPLNKTQKLLSYEKMKLLTIPLLSLLSNFFLYLVILIHTFRTISSIFPIVEMQKFFCLATNKLQFVS